MVLSTFDIDKRSGKLSIKKGAVLDVNHLKGESILFSVEVSAMEFIVNRKKKVLNG